MRVGGERGGRRGKVWGAGVREGGETSAFDHGWGAAWVNRGYTIQHDKKYYISLKSTKKYSGI